MLVWAFVFALDAAEVAVVMVAFASTLGTSAAAVAFDGLVAVAWAEVALLPHLRLAGTTALLEAVASISEGMVGSR